MKKNIIHKVPQGKLLRIEVEIEKFIIKEIKITGDFFIHPEEAISEIEEFLTGKKIDKTKKELSDFLIKKNIHVIGFSPRDVQEALTGS